MLTRISIVTGLLIAGVQLAILFGVGLNTEQLAAITGFITLAGGAVHAWFNPSVPFGKTTPETGAVIG